MKYRLFLVGFLSFSSLLMVTEAIASAEIEQSQSNENSNQHSSSALIYLEKMQQAYKKLNYELLYINTGMNEVEPKQLIHGVINNQRIRYFSFLNGAMRESVQFDGKISFYEQGNQAYSLTSKRDQSVFANIANFDFEMGNHSYEYIVLGKSRIAGKKALAIRMISKDEFRYSYIIWLDLNSFLPLRLDTISKSNLIIDQIMAISLNVTETVNPWIAQLSEKKIPEVLHLPKMVVDEEAEWQVNWLPEGFQIIKDDQHKLMMHDPEPVSYIMLSDGIVTASIYIANKLEPNSKHKSIIQRGATLLYTKQQGNIEINIIGDIPVATAERIAASIRMVEE